MKYLLLAAAALFIFGSSRRLPFAVAAPIDLVYVAWRGIASGRLPIIGPHDTISFFAASIGLLTLPVLLAPAVRERRAFSQGCGILAGIFSLIAFLFPSFEMPLPPVLRTMWFEAHVALAFFAYALFGVGAILGWLYLRDGERGLLDLQYRAALVGYTFFSLSMVSGGIWGYFAWGTYWLWTPKELWTSILWLFYSLYLHLRLKGAGWDRFVAKAGIAGFGVAMFTYLGVSMLMKSSHSF